MALTYPQTPTTSWKAKRGKISGGTVPSVVASQHHMLWRKKDDFNTQYLFRCEHLFITHIYFVGIGYVLVAVEHPITTVERLQHDEANDAQAGRLMCHASFVPTVEGWQDMDIRGQQSLFLFL